MKNNIKVLIVSGQYPSASRPLVNIFLKEQVDALRKYHPYLTIDIFNIRSELNRLNYLKRRNEFKKFVNANHYDIVHYHYGLTASIGLYQKINAKQLISFHGSDLNIVRLHRAISRRAARKFDHSIVVSNSLLNKIKPRNYSVIPCGVNADQFMPMDKIECRKQLGFPLDKKLILFPANKKNPVKNYKFFEKASTFLNCTSFEVIELKNVARKDVPLYMNAVDVVVLTSIREGSPQVIKEAAFCGKPIVSVGVADVEHILEGSNNSHVVDRDEKLFAKKIMEAVEKGENTGFKNLTEYDNKVISSKINNLYHMLVNS